MLFQTFSQEASELVLLDWEALAQKWLKGSRLFGCNILLNSRKEKPNVSYPFHSNIHELAAGSDVFVICCALNEQTHHMLNKEVILALGKEGVIVNVGCGAIVDEKEIVKCLLHERVEVLVLTCTRMNLMFLKSSVELIMFCCQPIQQALHREL